MIHFVTLSTQDNCMRDYLSLWGKALDDRIRIVHYEDLLAQSSPAPGTYILAALDQLAGPSVELLAQFHQALSRHPEFRFVNHPDRTLQRYELLVALHQAGSNEFRVLPATADLDSLRLPIFLRGRSRHDGPLTPLLCTRRQIDGGRALVARRLGTLRDVMAVEFCDTADEHGIYRKYAAFFVGDRVIPRSLFHGRHWMLKQAAADFNVNWSTEELAYVVENPHHEQLSRIREIAGVEYGRIDYSIRNGRVQTWEINLKPTIGRGRLRLPSGRVPADLIPIRQQVKEAFYREFQAALEALDDAAPQRVDRPVRIQAATGRLTPIGAQGRVRLPRLRRWLRPVWSYLVSLERLAVHLRDRTAIALLAAKGRRVRENGRYRDGPPARPRPPGGLGIT
jgi:hypothetical protein